MEHILFVIPPYVNYDSFVNPSYNDGTATKKSGRYRNVVADIPMGILSLSAYLKKHQRTTVKLIDFNIILNKLDAFNYKSFSQMYDEILCSKESIDFQPTIIGISALFSPAYYNLIDLSQVARRRFPNALIIAGGGVPTNMYNEIMRDSSCFDALCFGEGEKPMLGLISSPDKIEFFNNNTSWITKSKVKKKQAFKHDFIENLDEIPFFDYDILNIDDYRLNPVLSTFPLAQERMNSLPIMTSRGCPHRCCFCASHTVHGREMRYHSINRIKEDFIFLKEKYDTRAITFFDDHLMSKRQRVFEIVSILKDLHLTAFFPASLTLYALDKKVLEALKSVGLDQLVLSVESGSNRVLREIMHKPLKLSIVSQVISDCRELDISPDVAILIGLPGETKQDIDSSIAFLKTLNATWFRINVATPLVGSEMLEICLNKKYIRGDYIGCDFKRAVIETEDFTAEYIQEKAYSMNLELNFVGNSDFKLGNYSTALKGFQNTIRVKDDHAFAYYFAAKCYKEMGLNNKYQEYKSNYYNILTESSFWRNYAHKFDLPQLD